MAGRAGAPVTDVEIVRAGVERIDDLRRALPRAARPPPQSVGRRADRAGRPRLGGPVATYTGHFSADRAILHLALRDGTPVGYAFTVLHDGSDDTFPLAPRYAELYTLAVAPEARRAGIGTALLDAVDATLNDLGITSLTVAVMADNEAAIRLYQRRGMVPGELILYRLGTAAD